MTGERHLGSKEDSEFGEYPNFSGLLKNAKSNQLKAALVHLARNADRDALKVLEEHLDPSFLPETLTAEQDQTPLEELKLNAKTLSAFKRKGYTTIGHFAGLTEDEFNRLERLRGLGPVGLDQVRAALTERGVSFRSPGSLDRDVHELLHGRLRR